MTTLRLTPDEDGLLRRLEFFEQFGARLALGPKALKTEIRLRDRRLEVRPPQDVVELQPA